MAKKSMIAKSKREPKFSTRQQIAVLAVVAPVRTTASSVCAASAFVSSLTKANCPA